jgi:hypothetical protein
MMQMLLCPLGMVVLRFSVICQVELMFNAWFMCRSPVVCDTLITCETVTVVYSTLYFLVYLVLTEQFKSCLCKANSLRDN